MRAFILFLMAAVSMSACQHVPGGSKIGIELEIGGGKPPTFEQAEAWRRAHAAELKDRVLINGEPVDKKKYPAVIRIKVGGSGCTAAVVGKRTILTAAHCGNTGQTAQFTTVTGKTFSAKLQRAPGYPGKDLDIALGFTSVDIDVAPLPVRMDRFEKKGMKIQLIGFGCTIPGGTGGNDGVLRSGFTKVLKGQGYDLVLEDGASGAALCYGDSGGPALYTGEDGKLVIIGVNSKGNIEDVSYTTRLTLDEAKAFMESNGVFAGSGGGEPPPPTDPNPVPLKPGQKVQVQCET